MFLILKLFILNEYLKLILKYWKEEEYNCTIVRPDLTIAWTRGKIWIRDLIRNITTRILHCMKVSQGNGQIRNNKNTQRSVETRPWFYEVIRAMWRSSHLQGRYKGSTFISRFFLREGGRLYTGYHFSVILRTWVLVWPQESNPRRPCLQSTALLTELVRPSRPGLVQHRGNRQLASNLKLRDVAAVHKSVLVKGQVVKLETFKFDGLFGNIKTLKIAVLLWRTKLLLSFCFSGVILCARLYVLFVSKLFSIYSKKKNNNNNNKIKDTFLIPGMLTQTSHQNTRATDRRRKYLD